MTFYRVPFYRSFVRLSSLNDLSTTQTARVTANRCFCLLHFLGCVLQTWIELDRTMLEVAIKAVDSVLKQSSWTIKNW